MEMNGKLAKEVDRINKVLADAWCKSIWGVATDEFVKRLIEEENDIEKRLAVVVKEVDTQA